MKFEELNLITPILKAVAEEGYETPTPIQAQAIPLLLEKRDLVGCAQTGTGKTAAFSIPILQLLTEKPHSDTHRKAIRCLILTPTRELALQIGESLAAYGRHLPLRTAVIFGGVSQVAQTEALKRGVDILVATPGRLLDLIGQKYIELHHVEIFVLDEAARMLDMGFAPAVKRVIGQLPEIRQNMLFSATMPPEIVKLVDKLLNEPAKVAVTPVSSTVEIIDQRVYFVGKKEKKLLLIHLLQNEEMKSVLVFTRTKHGADRVAKDLARAGITVAAIHGDKSQNNRVQALTQFKARKLRVLVATDIAARGIDVDELSHVVNFDLPNVPETYVHRIGRTGRAGMEGSAISFCDEEEKAYLKDIQKLIGKQVPIVYEQPYPLDKYVEPEPVEAPQGAGRGRNGRNGGQPARSQGESAEARGTRQDRAPQGANRRRGSAGADASPESGRKGSQNNRDAVDSRPAERPESSRPVYADGRDAEDRRPLDPDAYERMARLLDGRRGHTAGRSGNRRDVVRDAGGSRTAGQDRSGQRAAASRRNGNRSDGTAQQSGHQSGQRITESRRTESRTEGAARQSGQSSGKPGARPGRNADGGHRQPDRQPAGDSPRYVGRAAEQPGPFESSSFLSKPLKARPKGL